MKKIEITLYKFDELSKESQQKAINDLHDINVMHKWWEYIYEDAQTVDLKITSFDLDRNRHATGEFLSDSINCAELIMQEHGKETETHKIAEAFSDELYKMNSIKEEDQTPGYQHPYSVEDLKDDFLRDILRCYANLLQQEADYLESDEAIIETIKANDYDFTEEGDLYKGKI